MSDVAATDVVGSSTQDEVGDLSTLIDDAPDAVVVIDRAGIVQYANRRLSTMLGYQPASIVGQPYEVLVPDTTRELHHEHFRTFMEHPTARPMGVGLPLRARHNDGHEVAVEIALVPLHPPSTAVAAVIRDMTMQRLLVDRLAHANELVTLALAGANRQQVAQTAVELARRELDGQRCWLAEVDDDTMRFTVIAADGADADSLIGTELTLDHTRFGYPAELVGELDQARAMVSPIAGAGRRLGAFGIARAPSARRFEPIEREALQEFGDAVAVTLELVDIRHDLDHLRDVAERDRIARDLHDTVIQRLFAISLRLQSTPSSEIARIRTAEAVDALDDVIHEIRATIFNLQRHGAGARTLIADEIQHASVALGFEPRLRVEGPIDALVPEGLLPELAPVVREALSNVARHAHASDVIVTARAGDGRLRITIADDGVGIGAGDVSGLGLDNLRERARIHRGGFTIRDRPGGGTVAEWTVPIGRSQQRGPKQDQ